jgi:hypothetical protein
MRKEYEYKLQGDGRDSWIVTEFDVNDLILSKYMVYENPIVQQGAALKAVLANSKHY